MNNALYIWLGLSPSAPWTWIAPQTGGSGVLTTTSDGTDLAQAKFSDVIFILPGQWVACHSLALPDMKKASRLKAAQFAIEDKLGQNLASLHTALSQDANELEILVISKDKLQAVLSAASDAGLSPDYIYADFDCFPSELESIALPDRVIFPAQRCTLDTDWAQSWQSEYGASDLNLGAVQNFADVSRQIITEQATNLRCGSFSKKRSLVGLSQAVSAKQVSFFAGLSGALIVSLLARTLVQTHKFTKQAEEARTKSAQIYRDVTGAQPPNNPAQALLAQLKSQPAKSVSASQEMAAFFELLEIVPSVKVETLRYDIEREGIELRLEYPNFQVTTQLEAWAKAQGRKFEAQGAREQGGQLMGDAKFSVDGKS